MITGSNATKATTASGATYVGLTGLLAMLNAVSNPDLRTGMPNWVEVFVMPLVPSLITLVSGLLSKDPGKHAK